MNIGQLHENITNLKKWVHSITVKEAIVFNKRDQVLWVCTRLDMEQEKLANALLEGGDEHEA